MVSDSVWLRAMERNLPSVVYSLYDGESQEEQDAYFDWLATEDVDEIYKQLTELAESLKQGAK